MRAKILLYSTVCAFIVLVLNPAGNVQARDTAILPATTPGEPDLLGEGGLLDSLYGLENLRRIPDSVDQLWVNLGRARATARAAFTNVFRGPGSTGEFRSLGIVDAEGVFRQFLFEFDAGLDAQASGDLPSKSIAPVFRWGLGSTASAPGMPDWTSRPDDNRDGSDHMVTWLITGGESKGSYVIAWEDFEDQDYQDLVVEVSNVVFLEVSSDAPSSLIRVNTIIPDVSLADGTCSIIEAFNEANVPGSSSNTGDCDVGSQGLNIIELQEGSTYSLNKPISSADGNSGLPSIVGSVLVDGKSATIRKQDRNSPMFRIFRVADQGNLTIRDLTIAQGESEFEPSKSDGAGILNRGKLTLISTIIRDNWATDGDGGGISNLSSATLIRSTVNNNLAAKNGGGILNIGQMEIAESAIISNQTDVNLGLCCAFDGGGILNHGLLELTNSTVASNQAGIYGGGIANAGDLLLVNSTVARNDAGFTAAGGGVLPEGGGGGISGGAVVSNSIIASNRNSGISLLLENCTGSLTSLGHNIDDDGGCGLSDPTDLPNTDPRFDSFVDSEQPGKAYFSLLADSPAIDSARNDACPTTDQRHRLRPSDGDGNGSANCDIGSIEFFPVVNGLIEEDKSKRWWKFDQLPVPGGPKGTLKIRAVFTNGDTPIRNPFFEVIQLSSENVIDPEKQNVLINADDGPGRLGSILSIDVGNDMVLRPNETFKPEFIIGLHSHERLQFFVNLRGEPSE